MEKYTVDLTPKHVEKFEEKGENVGEVSVYKNGKDISSNSRVMLR
ncbi:hypothetical protein [Numidum massiliense]|nr:hypothetical protein [Numidum massiliense]